MNVIDLAAVREKIAANRRLATAVCEHLAYLLMSESIRQAERAFGVAGPIAATDQEMSRIIHRGALRRLRADMRKAFDKLHLKDWAAETAGEIYTGRVLAMIEERDAQGGRS